jgi:pimeloyl-ACP methyl ester carboxylesterase
MSMERLQAWRDGGTFVTCPCGTAARGAPHRVWTRVDGDGGPWVTVIHGFPTSSWDMVDVVEMLRHDHRVLALDMIGFGESDRPGDHVYSITEQAYAVAAAWQDRGITRTALLAHDLGASVAQELLWRDLQGNLGVALDWCVLANGGIYPDLHRPLDFQTALADPERGPQVSAGLTEESMGLLLQLTFGTRRTLDAAEQHAMWDTISRHDGHRNMHLLIRYMEERRERERDWVGALESTRVPLGFAWGMRDPISGAHIAERIVERFPGAPRRLLDDVAHWPPIEAPDEVVAVAREVETHSRP